MITTDQGKEINNLISIVYEETEHYTLSCNFLPSSNKMTVYNEAPLVRVLPRITSDTARE